MSSSKALYHFTCGDHGWLGITRDQQIRPYRHPFMKHLGPLLWLTDLAEPSSPEDIGLTSTMLSCDRTEHRFTVTTRAAMPWTSVRDHVQADVIEALETFGYPERWWVVRRPLTTSEFTYDKQYDAQAR